MKRLTVIFVLLTAFVVLAVTAQNTADYDKNWPEWRGPLVSGVTPNSDPVVEWSETKNVKWKIAIPGKGHSTPIIWGDRMFLLTAVPTDKVVEVKKKPAMAPGQGMANPHVAQQPGQKMSGNAAQAHGAMQSQPQERGLGQPWRRGMTMNRSDQIHQFVVVALNRINGKIIWQKTVKEECPEEGTHEF